MKMSTLAGDAGGRMAKSDEGTAATDPAMTLAPNPHNHAVQPKPTNTHEVQRAGRLEEKEERKNAPF